MLNMFCCDCIYHFRHSSRLWTLIAIHTRLRCKSDRVSETGGKLWLYALRRKRINWNNERKWHLSTFRCLQKFAFCFCIFSNCLWNLCGSNQWWSKIKEGESNGVKYALFDRWRWLINAHVITRRHKLFVPSAKDAIIDFMPVCIAYILDVINLNTYMNIPFQPITT